MFMTNIYVLKLEQNKYYIGKSNNIDIRLNDHMNGNGSQWTKKYKPIEITEVILIAMILTKINIPKFI